MPKNSLPDMVLVYLVLFAVMVFPVEAQNIRDGIEKIAEQFVEGSPKDRELKVVVVDFPDLLNITSNLGRYVANRLTTRLAQSEKFFVVERQRLGQVLAELKFSMSDLVDPEKAKELGKMVGVEAIVVGTISDLGSQVDLDARLIEIESRRMLLSATATISKDQVVSQLIELGRTAEPSPATVSTSSEQSASHPVMSSPGVVAKEFQNGFLRVMPISINLRKDRKQITLALQFENISKKDLLLSIVQNNNQRVQASLIDNRGNVFSLERLDGVSIAYVPYGRQNQKESYSLFTPGAKHAVVMVFTSEQETEDNFFSFSSEYFRFVEAEDQKSRTRIERVSVGIANMQIQ